VAGLSLWTLMPANHRGTFSEGTDWCLDSSSTDDEVWLHLDCLKAGVRDSGGFCRGPVMPEADVVRVNMWSQEPVHYAVGQVAKRVAALTVHFNDGGTAGVEPLLEPDLPVNVFVAEAPSGRWIAHVTAHVAGGAAIGQSREWDPNRTRRLLDEAKREHTRRAGGA
jgi:hypothetical protein